MKKQILVVACAIITLTMSTYASEKLDRLRSEYSKKATKEIGDINSQYEKKLKMALANAEKFNKQEEAEEIREELEALKDPAYLLQGESASIKPLVGAWITDYGYATRRLRIDRFGKVKVDKALNKDGTEWVSGGLLEGRLEYNATTQEWVLFYQINDEVFVYQAYHTEGETLIVKRWINSEYPSGPHATLKGTREDA